MSTRTGDERNGREERPAGEAVERVEAYEADGGLVLFDGYNPLAWVHSSLTVRLSDLT
ncbi:DUF7331 family protein [Natronorarus salvus]|uniref:DUF7331 family protein n=1 Tax=Natronorarus salvus TaxID=3117733 RepID=UPI002F26B77B